jgi:Uma2 family endonuclease
LPDFAAAGRVSSTCHTELEPREEVTTMTSPHSFDHATLDDWDDLDPTEGQRFELVDGQFRMNAAPTPWHQIICDELRSLLAPVVKPRGWRVVSGIGVRLLPGNGFIPDLVICEPIPRGVKSIPASTVALAVEVVSPSSRKIDRFQKPFVYAKAGIEAYWRAEVVKDRLTSLHCYRRDDAGVYVEHDVIDPGTPRTIALPIGAEVTIDLEALDGDD